MGDAFARAAAFFRAKASMISSSIVRGRATASKHFHPSFCDPSPFLFLAFASQVPLPAPSFDERCSLAVALGSKGDERRRLWVEFFSLSLGRSCSRRKTEKGWPRQRSLFPLLLLSPRLHLRRKRNNKETRNAFREK